MSQKKTGLDKLLGEWPIPEPSALDWDEAAAHIEARIARGFKTDETGEMRTYMTDEEIFSPAAGQTEKDGHNSASPIGDAGEDATARLPQQAAQIQNKAAEDSKMSLTTEQRERDRKSLQDLARMAQLTPQPPSSRSMPVAQPSGPASGVSAKGEKQDDVMLPASRAEDSGLVNLSALAAPSQPASQPGSSQPPMSMRGADVQARHGANVPAAPNTSPMLPPVSSRALAQEGLFDEEPAQSVPPPALIATLPSGAVPQGVQPMSERPSAVTSVAPPSLANQVATQKKSGAAIYMIGAVVALAAVAAGGFFVVKPRLMKANAPQAVAVATPVTPTEPEVAVPSTRWQDQVVAQNTATPTPTLDLTVAPASLPPAQTAPATSPKPMSVAKAAPIGKASKPDNKVADQLAAASPPPAPAPLPPDPTLAKNATPPQVVNGGNLDVAMKAAAGPADSTNTGAQALDNKPQFAAGTVPQRPSQGAVTGAIGAALPEARACLGADDPVSRATMTFGSSGAVQSVSVHGAATGKPAEACIKAALMKAKVPPFAEATYTANITVRH